MAQQLSFDWEAAARAALAVAAAPRARAPRKAQTRAAGRVEGELALLAQLGRETAPRARQRLLDALVAQGQWRPQIRALAARWARAGVEPSEYVQAGLQGLFEAAARYDGRAVGWPSYATAWIRRRIAELARAQGGPVVAETQWEQRQRRRRGESSRPAAWAELNGDLDAAPEPSEDVGAARRAALDLLLAELPEDRRAALLAGRGSAADLRWLRERLGH